MHDISLSIILFGDLFGILSILSLSHIFNQKRTDSFKLKFLSNNQALVICGDYIGDIDLSYIVISNRLGNISIYCKLKIKVYNLQRTIFATSNGRILIFKCLKNLSFDSFDLLQNIMCCLDEAKFLNPAFIIISNYFKFRQYNKINVIFKKELILSKNFLTRCLQIFFYSMRILIESTKISYEDLIELLVITD